MLGSRTGLAVSDIALMLSHQIVALLLVFTCNSLSSDYIHMIYDAVLAMLLYSASILDIDTVDFFLAHQDTGFFF